jgi:hypothetical protein
MKNKSLFSLAMAVLLITACGPQTVSLPPGSTAVIEHSPTQLPAAIPTETPNPLGEVKVYRDTNAGFALDYLAAWFIEEGATQDAAGSVIYTVSLFSLDHVSRTPMPKDLNTFPDGETKIDITVFNQDPNTLEETVNQYKSQDSGSSFTFLKEEDWTLDSGEKAAYLESEGAFGVIATIIMLVDRKVVYVSGYGNLTPFKAIALTLRSE